MARFRGRIQTKNEKEFKYSSSSNKCSDPGREKKSQIPIPSLEKHPNPTLKKSKPGFDLIKAGLNFLSHNILNCLT